VPFDGTATFADLGCAHGRALVAAALLPLEIDDPTIAAGCWRRPPAGGENDKKTSSTRGGSSSKDCGGMGGDGGDGSLGGSSNVSLNGSLSRSPRAFFGGLCYGVEVLKTLALAGGDAGDALRAIAEKAVTEEMGASNQAAAPSSSSLLSQSEEPNGGGEKATNENDEGAEAAAVGAVARGAGCVVVEVGFIEETVGTWAACDVVYAASTCFGEVQNQSSDVVCSYPSTAHVSKKTRVFAIEVPEYLCFAVPDRSAFAFAMLPPSRIPFLFCTYTTRHLPRQDLIESLVRCASGAMRPGALLITLNLPAPNSPGGKLLRCVVVFLPHATLYKYLY